MIVYVTRDDTGAISGVFAQPQPQLNSFEMDDQDPAVVAHISAGLVPQRVAMWQAKAALDQAGLLTQADAAIAAMGNSVLNHFWATAANIDRTSPTLAQLASKLSLTSAQIDALFTSAAQISL